MEMLDVRAEPPRVLGVIGESDASSENYQSAYQVGRLAAQAGLVLVNGGLAGVMEGAARGAKSAGGMTIGILPGSRRWQANQYIDLPIITGIGYARNKIVVKTAQVLVAIGGRYGTLSEIAFALDYRIPVIGLNTWEMIREGEMDTAIVRAKTAPEAIEHALRLFKQIEAAGMESQQDEYSK